MGMMPIESNVVALDLEREQQGLSGATFKIEIRAKLVSGEKLYRFKLRKIIYAKKMAKTS